MLSKEKLNLFLQYLLSFLIILESRSVFSRFVESSLEKYVIALMILILFIIFILNFNLKFKKNCLLFLLFYLIYVVLFLFINVKSDKINFYVIFCFLFPLFFLVFNTYEKKDLENLLLAYVNIMFVISCISLFFFIFGSLTNIIPTNVIKTINWGGTFDNNKTINGYYYLHFNTQTTVMFGKIILRNTSIFVEGPMFALHLMFAIALSLFLKRKILNKYSIIFGLTIFSTLSLTGILFYLFLLFYKYAFYNKSKLKTILLPIVFITFLIIGIIFLNDKQTTSSYNIRNDDYSAGFQVFEKYPLFGSGFLNNSEVIKYMSSYRMYNTGLSSSFIIVLIHGGIYLLLFYLIPIFLNCKNLIFSKRKNLFLLEIMLLQLYILFISTYQYTSLMMMILAFDYYILLFYKKSNEVKLIFLEEEQI